MKLDLNTGTIEDRIAVIKRQSLAQTVRDRIGRDKISYEDTMLMLLEQLELRRPYFQARVRGELTDREYRTIRYHISRFCIAKYTGNTIVN